MRGSEKILLMFPSIFDTGVGGSTVRIRKIWAALRYAFEEKQARNINNGLARDAKTYAFHACTNNIVHTSINNEIDAVPRLSKHGTGEGRHRQHHRSLSQTSASPGSPEPSAIPPYVAIITFLANEEGKKTIKLQRWQVQHSDTERIIFLGGQISWRQAYTPSPCRSHTRDEK